MGIDVYARWDGFGEAEERAQLTAWLSNTDGDVGYLREAYHGEPYATRHLVPEAFESPEGVCLPARTLRERLPETLRLAELRERSIYGAKTSEQIEAMLRSFTAFVELCEQVEQTTGKPVRIIASW